MPPSIENLSKDQEKIKILREIPSVEINIRRIDDIEKALLEIEQLETTIRAEIQARLEQIIKSISKEIQQIWEVMHPEEPIEEVEIYTPEGSEGGVDISLKFFGVLQPSPRLTLSEGHRNSLGLAIFLAMAIVFEPEKPLLLDDVVTSLDREHRSSIAKLFKEKFGDRQIILLTHHREWFLELRHILSAKEWGFRTLVPWKDPELGILWSDSRFTFDDAGVPIEKNPKSSGNITRSIMDTELSIIAEMLKVQMEYRRGDKNDIRGAPEFLQKLISEMPKKLRVKKEDEEVWEKIEGCENVVVEAKVYLLAWSNRASHTGSLAKREAEEMIGICERALEAFVCDDCHQPLGFAYQTKSARPQCRCGKHVWYFDK